METIGDKRDPEPKTVEDKWLKVKLLVTGASGLLGTRVCELAMQENYEVISVHSQHSPQFGTPLRLDLVDRTATGEAFEKTKPDVVVHAAALSDVDKCERERELAWKINVEGTSTIARLCHKYDCFLVYVSTDYVFDGDRGSYRETDPTNPINHYGVTKLRGEDRVKQSDTVHCITRTSVIYGSNPAAGKTNFGLWVIEKLKKKEEVKTVTDQWNSPTLNTNLASMILEIVDKRHTGTIHLAGATRLSRHEFAKEIARKFNLDQIFLKPVSCKEMPWLAKRPKDSSLNVDKANQTLTSRPLNIDEALSKLKTEMR